MSHFSPPLHPRGFDEETTSHGLIEDPRLSLRHTVRYPTAEMNQSTDMTTLADVCGIFGLSCFALVVISFLLYVGLILWRSHRPLSHDTRNKYEGGREAGETTIRSTRYQDEATAYSTDLSTLDHGVSHLAVIMDGNRRYGKRVSQRWNSAGSDPARAAAIKELCQELCFQRGEGASANVTQAPKVPDAAIVSAGYNRAWLTDRYRYFLSLIHSTALDGHRQGGEKLIDFIRYSIEARISMLTVYAFSTDNWQRPAHEVDALMTLFFFFFDRIRQTARQEGIFVRFVSTSPQMLPPRILQLMRAIESESREYTPRHIVVNVCVSYSGQQEVLLAANRVMARHVALGRPNEPIRSDELDAEMLRSVTQDAHEEVDRDAVFSAVVPREPQMVLRTSGEQRISNFLLYESAYSEFVFTTKTWPEITRADMAEALQQFASRHRRVGR